jgi:transposase
MFWGSFCYYKKGPCHIWEAETAAEKKACKADLDARNTEVEAENRRRWEEKVANEKAVWEKEHKRKKGGPKPK